MRTAAYKDDAASGRRRRQNVPRHILCSNKTSMQKIEIDKTNKCSYNKNRTNVLHKYGESRKDYEDTGINVCL